MSNVPASYVLKIFWFLPNTWTAMGQELTRAYHHSANGMAKQMLHSTHDSSQEINLESQMKKRPSSYQRHVCRYFGLEIPVYSCKLGRTLLFYFLWGPMRSTPISGAKWLERKAAPNTCKDKLIFFVCWNQLSQVTPFYSGDGLPCYNYKYRRWGESRRTDSACMGCWCQTTQLLQQPMMKEQQKRHGTR